MALLRRAILLIAALGVLVPTLAQGYQVLLLLSTRDRIYTEAAEGVVRGRFSQRTLVLSDYAEADMARTIREDKPAVIVAVGDRALAAVRKVQKTPVLSLMSLSFPRVAATASAISGVELFIKPERYLSLFETMRLKRVGVLYSPMRSGEYLHKAQGVAARYGIELVTRTVHSPKEALGQLASLKGSVDAIWMIPDAAAVDHKSAEAYFLFSLAEKIPVISFDRSHLQLGAAAIIEPDREEMGHQVAEMVTDLLTGASIQEMQPVAPQKHILKVNFGVLKHLGIRSDAPSRLISGKE